MLCPSNVATSLRLTPISTRFFAKQCRNTWAVTIGSAVLGGLSHLGFDVFMHYDTPLLWPWRDQPIAAVPWAVDPIWSWGIELVAGALFFAMVWKWVSR